MKKKLSTVLLIDDDEPTNVINRLVIDAVNCAENIVAVESAREGLAYLAECSSRVSDVPELIFLDINMPGLSGWDFLEEYRKMPEQLKKQPRIVMLTTSLNPDDQKKAQTIEEVTGFRCKSLTPEMMKDLLSEYFSEYL